MAHSYSNRAAPFSVIRFSFAPLTYAIAKLATWNTARITRQQLQALTEHELADIGLTYGDIDQIAKRNAL